MEFDWPVRYGKRQESPLFSKINIDNNISGRCQGQAWIDYETGIVKKMHIEFEATLTPTKTINESEAPLALQEGGDIRVKGRVDFSS